ncbi:MAG: exodeoxyribonuclease III [Thermocladium sp.]|nr:MAG: exodeoxyribonuclease III [Thermocladium sp. ECH_B]
MKLLSWNVNGLRAAMGKGLIDIVRSGEYDILMFQEIRTSEVPLDFQVSGYETYVFPAKRSGYSGTMTLTRLKPLSVKYGLGIEEFDAEGRVITLELSDLYVINVYFPNAGEELRRLDFKLRFDDAFEEFLLNLNKPVIACGDFNVAHEERDIARPKDNLHHAGFTVEERERFSRLLAKGFLDTYRLFVQEGGHYTWWSYRFHAREKNIGWRIDYCIASQSLRGRIRRADILDKVMGSDHAPVILEID